MLGPAGWRALWIFLALVLHSYNPYIELSLKKKKNHLLVERPISCVRVTFAMAQPVDVSVAGALEIKLHAFSWSNLRQWNAQGSLADLPA